MEPLTPKRLLVILLLVAAAAVSGLGCGSGTAQTVSTTSIPKAEFVDRVEAICARGRTRGTRYQPPQDAEQSEQDALAEAIDASLLPAIQAVVDEIYALGAPRDEEAQTEAFLVALQEAVDEAEDLDVPTLEELDKLLAQSGKLARKAGFESCIYN